MQIQKNVRSSSVRFVLLLLLALSLGTVTSGCGDNTDSAGGSFGGGGSSDGDGSSNGDGGGNGPLSTDISPDDPTYVAMKNAGIIPKDAEEERYAMLYIRYIIDNCIVVNSCYHQSNTCPTLDQSAALVSRVMRECTHEQVVLWQTWFLLNFDRVGQPMFGEVLCSDKLDQYPYDMYQNTRTEYYSKLPDQCHD